MIRTAVQLEGEPGSPLAAGTVCVVVLPGECQDHGECTVEVTDPTSPLNGTRWYPAIEEVIV